MQHCIKCQGKSTSHFVYFWSRKTLPYSHLEATSYIPQQGQSLHFWTTSLFTTGCYINKYTIQFLWMACISRFAKAILSEDTELALGTIRVNKENLERYKLNKNGRGDRATFTYTKFSGTTILMSTTACAFANLWLANLNRNCIMYPSTIGSKCVWHMHLPSTVKTLRCYVLLLVWGKRICLNINL